MAIEAGTSTYYQAKRGIVQDGLVLHLDAGVKESYSGGTTWRDLSGNNHNFTLYNNPSFVREKGGCFIFDGSNTYATTPSTALLTTTTPSVTVVCTVTAYNSAVINKGAYASYWNYGIVRVRENYFYARNNNADVYSGANFTYKSAGNIVVCTATWDGSSCNFYRDGIYGGSNSYLYSPVANNSRYLRIGSAIHANGSSSEYYDGKIYAVYVYNKTLSASEVLQNYNATRHRFGL